MKLCGNDDLGAWFQSCFWENISSLWYSPTSAEWRADRICTRGCFSLACNLALPG